ncbi:hypothetical protein [Novosphingobium sp.]|uniref:hypothetical protein n=1 Tax=Novosphingobium sp. TaxID=1874826 RepID=UPI0025CD279C|nr:hypothetical protein [Novosphingobium sp.]
MTMFHRAPIAAAALSLLAGCGQAVTATLPQGETNLTCAASIFAAANLLDNKKAGVTTDFGSYLSAMTAYGTALAKEEGIGAQEALGKIKLKAYRMTGVGGTKLPNDEVRARATKCAGG